MNVRVVEGDHIQVHAAAAFFGKMGCRTADALDGIRHALPEPTGHDEGQDGPGDQRHHDTYGNVTVAAGVDFVNQDIGAKDGDRFSVAVKNRPYGRVDVPEFRIVRKKAHLRVMVHASQVKPRHFRRVKISRIVPQVGQPIGSVLFSRL